MIVGDAKCFDLYGDIAIKFQIRCIPWVKAYNNQNLNFGLVCQLQHFFANSSYTHNVKSLSWELNFPNVSFPIVANFF